MRLIVNADDLGYSPGINRGIIHGFRRGVVTSTTLMVNQACCHDGAKRALRAGLPAGLHLNLTHGRPLSEPRAVSTLINEEGLFYSPDALYSCHPVAAEVETEIEAQLEKASSLGIVPTHLDAHHHLQEHPVVRAAMIKVAAKHKLPLRQCSEAVKTTFNRAGISTPHIFVSSFWDDKATTAHLCEVLGQLSESCTESEVVELMTHPGLPDRNITQSSYYRQRMQELRVLCSPEARDLIMGLKIKLVDYRVLHSK